MSAYKYDILLHCRTIVQPVVIPRTTNIRKHWPHWNGVLLLNPLLDICRNPLPLPGLQS